MYRERIIQEENKEECVYGIQITLANLINFLIAFGIGFLADSLFEIALFYSVFVSLRFFCGGYHAKSYIKCFSLFTVTCLAYLVMLRGVMEFVKNKGILLGVAFIVLGICIFAKAPIEHENRAFTEKERKHFRKRSIQLYLVWSLFGVLLWVKQIEHLSVGLICVFIIISIYMVVERREENEEKSS